MTSLANPLGAKPFYWNVEYVTVGGARIEWRSMLPAPSAHYRLKVRPWIPHDGGPCPVEPHVRVRVRFRYGEPSSQAEARAWVAFLGFSDWWQHQGPDGCDIIAYQIMDD